MRRLRIAFAALLITAAIPFCGLDYSPAAGRPEILRYEVTWNGNKAGHGDVTTTWESDHAKVVVQAVTDGVLKAMIEIWSRVQAAFQIKTFRPLWYKFHMKSNRLRTELVDLQFNHKKKLVTVNKQRGDEIESHKEKFKEIYDPVTASCLLRSQKDFRKPMFVDMYDGKDRARLYVQYVGKGPLSVKGGQFQAVALDLRVVKLSGEKEEVGKGKLWLSDDRYRIPLLLTSSPLVGTVRFELVQVQR